MRVSFFILFLVVSCQSPERKPQDTTLNQTAKELINAMLDGDSIAIKKAQTKLDQVPNPDPELKAAFQDYVDLTRWNAIFAYDSINNLPWKTVDVLSKNQEVHIALDYGYYKCWALFYSNQEKESIKQIDALLLQFEKNTKDCLIGELYKLRAVVYLRLNYYQLALQNLQKASLFCLHQDDCEEIKIGIEIELSYLYATLKQYKESLKSAQKALSYSKEKLQFSGSHAAIAKAYLALKQPREALFHLQKALAFVQATDFHQKNFYKSLLMETYYDLGQHEDVDVLFLELNQEAMFFSYHQYLFHRYKAKSLLKRNEVSKALEHFMLAKGHVPDLYLINERVMIQEISETYFRLNNYQKAHAFLQQYTDLETSFTQQEIQNRISEQTVLLQLAEKEASIQNAKRKAIEQDLLIAQKNKTIVVGSLVAVSLLLLSLLFWYFNKIQKRKNKELAIEKQKVQETNAVLETTIQEKSLLMKEIHHRVKNHLQFLMCILRVQSRAKDISIEEFVDRSNARLTAIASIHHQLYEVASEDQLVLKTYLEKLALALKNIRDVECDIQIGSMPEEIMLSQHVSVTMGLIVNELISNSFKHAFSEKKRFINIQLSSASGRLQIVYEDSGSPIEEAEQISKSSGVEIIRILVSQIHGNITYFNNYSKAVLDFEYNR